MNLKTWKAFVAARDHYKEYIDDLTRQLPALQPLQQELVNRRTGPAYTVETPIVYNLALDEVTQKDDIKLILTADNPGRREQAAENRRYLVGPSGKIADRFFREHPELGIDFRQNVLILNKTPIHTPRTIELGELCRLGGPALTAAVTGSQKIMAELLLEFHKALAPVPVWIIGYSEMKKGGIFETYTETLRELYAPKNTTKAPAKHTAPLMHSDSVLWDQLFFYRHFSMNQFTIDLRQQTNPKESLPDALERIGRAYRKRVLEW
ncbi:hypothetical protein AGMMS50267_01010 [Spirochaetia bacterium]|nr:hypothetical protein AGMMS50267_01010 [Spirochaetia bacterium]